jgi:hypothetical protein
MKNAHTHYPSAGYREEQRSIARTLGPSPNLPISVSHPAGAETFDRLFAGIPLGEIDADLYSRETGDRRTRLRQIAALSATAAFMV